MRSRAVDYTLQRRAVLRNVYAGKVGTVEVCDATRYLLAAAKFHGDATQERCPICRREFLVLVNYIYTDEAHVTSGQARSRTQLDRLAATVRELRVFAVEVCPGCGWNYLIEQFLIGTAVGPPLPEAPAVSSARPTRARAGRRQPAH